MSTFGRTAGQWAAIGGVLACLLGSPAAAQEQAVTLSPEQRFHRAAVAYDRGEHDEAARLYQALIEEGWVSAALLYNLGNAQFRAGDSAQAALSYRRAWAYAPRDPDIRGNLAHVLNQTQAVAPADHPWTGILYGISAEEYARLGVTAYWLMAALFIGSCFRPLLRTPARRLALPLAVAAAAGFAGAGSWSGWWARERVIVSPDQYARYAPLDDAQPFFALPPGSLVREVEEDPPWIKIAVNGKSGWIRSSASVKVALEAGR